MFWPYFRELRDTLYEHFLSESGQIRLFFSHEMVQIMIYSIVPLMFLFVINRDDKLPFFFFFFLWNRTPTHGKHSVGKSPTTIFSHPPRIWTTPSHRSRERHRSISQRRGHTMRGSRKALRHRWTTDPVTLHRGECRGWPIRLWTVASVMEWTTLY